MVHEDHAVGHVPSESHFVGDDHHRHPLPGQVLHDREDLPDHLGVEGGGRLVEEHADRVHRERSRDGHPLLLAPGELTGVLLREIREAHPLEECMSLLEGLFFFPAEDLDLPDREIPDDRHVGEQLEMLEHHPHARTELGKVRFGVPNRGPVHQDLAFLERFQAVDALDERRLARAGGSAHHDHFSLLHLRGAPGEDLEPAVPLAHVPDLDHGHAASPDSVIERRRFSCGGVSLSSTGRSRGRSRSPPRICTSPWGDCSSSRRSRPP